MAIGKVLFMKIVSLVIERIIRFTNFIFIVITCTTLTRARWSPAYFCRGWIYCTERSYYCWTDRSRPTSSDRPPACSAPTWGSYGSVASRTVPSDRWTELPADRSAPWKSFPICTHTSPPLTWTPSNASRPCEWAAWRGDRSPSGTWGSNRRSSLGRDHSSRPATGPWTC